MRVPTSSLATGLQGRRQRRMRLVFVGNLYLRHNVAHVWTWALQPVFVPPSPMLLGIKTSLGCDVIIV